MSAKYRRILGVSAAALALLVFLAGILPIALRGTVERTIAGQLGRTVHIERLGFNPLKLAFSVEGLKVDGRRGEEPLLEVAALEARISPASIWRRAVIVAALRVEKPRLSVVRIADNRYNFSDILDKIKAEPSSGEATRFALYNFELTEGDIRFEDRPLAQKHRVEKLHLGLPMISSVPADIATYVRPELSARVDGSAFALGGSARPFLAVPEAKLAIRLAAFDLKPLLGYLPFKPAITLTEGRLATDLVLNFHQAPGQPAALSLSGRLEALDWKFAGRNAQPLAGFGRLVLDVAELDPAARRAQIRSVALERADLDVERDAAGRIRLVDDLAASLAALPADKGAKDAKDAKGEAWKWSLAVLHVAQMSVHVADGRVSPALALSLSPIDLDLKGLCSDCAKPAALKLALAADQGETLALEGRLSLQPLAWQGRVELKDLRPGRASPYLAGVLPKLVIEDGRVSASLPLTLQRGERGLIWSLAGGRLGITEPVLKLKGDKAPFFKAASVDLAGIDADSGARAIKLGSLALAAPEFSARRDPRGSIALTSLLPAGQPGKAGAASGKETAWKFALGEAKIESGALRLEDQTRKPALKLALNALDLVVRGYASDSRAPLELELKTNWNKGGTLALKGRVTPQPLNAKLAITASRLDIVPLIAQATEHYEVSVTRAKLDARGDLVLDLSRPDSPRARYRGQLGLSDFTSIDLLNDTDFVRWRQFALSRIDATLNPTSLAIGDAQIAGLQSRLILDAQGRLNLREVTREQDGEAPAAAKPASPATGSVAAPAALPPIRIARISVSGADIRYSDRFIKPSFDANLLGVKGSLSGLASDTRDIAKLSLAGTVDGGAPLSVDGQLAPFRNDRYLDLKAGVKGYELSALSAYAGKYVGYGIEKGKLSMDLRYQIVDRKLTAQNRLFLDQLTLGDKVDSPDATKLPVRFALSLLKNRRGEIDIELPIAGTLDDPQFSVGGIIWKMIGNFFAKIVTAPFSLLSGGGGDAQLANVPFAAGTQRLGPEALKRIETVAKALIDRPALKLELTGRADPAADLEGLRRESLQRKIRTEKLRQMARAGESGGSVDEVTISDKEYPELLERVYKDEKFAGKPRNLLGLAKSLPVAEMERLLIAHAPVRDADVRALAQARAEAVMRALLDRGAPAEQLFLLAPKLGAEADKAGASALQVDLSLR